MASPYREAVGTESLEARTREGVVCLEIAPRHVTLALDDSHRIAVTDQFVSLEKLDGRRTRRRSMSLDDAALVVARAHPTADVGLWYQEKPGVMNRVFGLEPVELLDREALAHLKDLDRLAGRLRQAIAEHSGGVVRAVELGTGADRVLLLDYGDRYVVYVRRLFRERPRLALEVHDDGTVRIPRRRRAIELTCRSRFGVTVLGDYIRFADRTGADLGAIRIPWITPEDRKELARRIGAMVQHEDEDAGS